MSAAMNVRVRLPTHLRRLARIDGEVQVDLAGPVVTLGAVLDAVESRHPELRGAIRDRATGRRRGFVRFFACQEDLSNTSPDDPLPDAIVNGTEPYLIVGAMAGG